MPAAAATSRFMKVSGATGESPISGHEQESEAIHFQWGVEHPASVQTGTGGSAGRTTFHDFTCTCYVDNAYPSIVGFCAGGKAIDEVKITDIKMTGDKGETFLTWTFNDVMCTSVTNSGGQLKLLNLTKRVKDLLQITKLYTVFEVFDDEAAAVRSFS